MRSPPRKCRPLAKQRTGRFPLRARASLSRSSSYLSAPLPAAPVRPSRPRHPRRAKGAGGLFARPKGRAVRPRSSERCASFFAHLPRPLAPPATSPRRSPQLRFVPAVLLVPAARQAQKLRSLAPRTCSLPEKQRLSHHPSLATLRSLARRAPSQSRSPQLRFVHADPIAQVARKAKEARQPAPLDVLLASG